MIRLATIGTNTIVEKFLQACKRSSVPYKYMAAYSRSQDKADDFAIRHGAVRGISEFTDLANAKDIDAVYVASPNSMHSSQAIELMQAKKHVLCEKAIASNLAELKAMITAAVSNRVVLLEAMRTAYDPAFEVIENNLGKLGRIRSLTFQYCQYSSRYDRYKSGVVENAFKPELSNGALMDIGIYCVYPLIRFFGLPESVQADAMMLGDGKGIDGTGSVLAHYDSGMQARLVYSKITNSSLPCEIQGEEASMLIEFISNPRRIWIKYNNGREEEIFNRGEESNMYHEIDTWCKLIKDNHFEHEYFDNMLQDMTLMDQIREKCGIRFPADLQVSSAYPE